jgi:hypothetical protein
MSEETAPTTARAETAAGGANALSAYYKFEAGAPLAYGGLAVAVVLAIAAKGAGSAALWVAAAAALLIALHNWPLVRQLSTAMSVSDYGVFLDGLGLVGWNGINAARVEERKLGKTTLPELVLDVDAEALKTVMARTPAGGFRRLQYRPWRVAGGHLLRVDLQPLGVDPQALLAAISPRLGTK